MNVELSDRAHLEMRRIHAVWRKQADFPELFLEPITDAALQKSSRQTFVGAVPRHLAAY